MVMVHWLLTNQHAPVSLRERMVFRGDVSVRSTRATAAPVSWKCHGYERSTPAVTSNTELFHLEYRPRHSKRNEYFHTVP